LPADWANQINQIRNQIVSAEGKVTNKPAYQPAARALALLCQSDPFFFLDEPPLTPAWTPPEILKLGPTWVHIDKDGASVEFGGGFHHFGYQLKRKPQRDTATQNCWVLDFYSEDNPTKRLTTFSVNKTDHIERTEFINRALAEFERRAALLQANSKTVPERIVFLLKFDEAQKARDSIHHCATASANDWMDQMLAYIVDHRVNPAGAAKQLDAWAAKMNDFSAWLYAAYTYGITDNAGDLDRCAQSALKFHVNDPDWCDGNARYRGVSVCIQLLRAKRYNTCAALCDTLMDYTDAGKYHLPELTKIHDLAKANKGSENPPALENGTFFDPFHGIDLSRLTIANSTTQAAATASSDRMVTYYDHRIAAEPNAPANYLTKIVYLLGKQQKSEALATCRKAADVFPNWWHPQMALVVLSDSADRPATEVQFQSWVKAHPSFIHWWYWSHYLQGAGRNADAIAALKEAVKYPLEDVDNDTTWVPAAFAFDAASVALKQNDFNLVLEITRVWSKPRGIYNYVSDDMYAFRAAAELSLGQFPAAKDDAAKVVKAAADHALWAGNLDPLKHAADSEDQHFVYDPGKLCGEWSLFSPQ
jgi:tetratricopeptide (TPR) repeat protein